MAEARFETYTWEGGRELMLRFGPDTGPAAIVAMPLFEEANRTRTFVVGLLRALALRGIASALPDVPGQGESLVPLETLSSTLDMENGFSAAVDHLQREGRKVYGVAIRSGALLDYGVELGGRWHLAPQNGPELLRELTRIRHAALEPGLRRHDFWHQESLVPEGEAQPPTEVAGNLIAARFCNVLKGKLLQDGAENGPWRVVRLDSDPGGADRHVPGTPLWRRSEPGDDPALAALLANDIADWIARCEG